MRALAVVSLMLATGLATVWYVVTSLRERRIGSRSWEGEPFLFVFEVLAYVGVAVVALWSGSLGVPDVPPVLWALWPGAVGPVLALVLSWRHWGERGEQELVEALAERLASGDLDAARRLIGARTRGGAVRRILSAALRAPPEPRAATDYRSPARRSWSELERALEDSFLRERRRGRLALLPATAVVVTCVLFVIAPPTVERGAAWVVLVAELALAALVLWSEHRRARHAKHVTGSLGALLRDV